MNNLKNKACVKPFFRGTRSFYFWIYFGTQAHMKRINYFLQNVIAAEKTFLKFTKLFTLVREPYLSYEIRSMFLLHLFVQFIHLKKICTN